MVLDPEPAGKVGADPTPEEKRLSTELEVAKAEIKRLNQVLTFVPADIADKAQRDALSDEPRPRRKTQVVWLCRLAFEHPDEDSARLCNQEGNVQHG